MKTKVLSTLLVITSMSIAGLAQEKQHRFGFEFNAGASMALTKPAGTTLKPGFGFDGVFHYRILSHTGIYAGWGWNRMAATASFAGDDVCFEETGYAFGIQHIQPLTNGPLAVFLRAGGLYKHIEVENAAGDITHDSGHGLGFQLAGGIQLDLGSNWSLQPGIRFNYLSRELDIEGVTEALDHHYLSLRLGLVKMF